MKMVDKILNHFEICKVHWKEIFALSFMWHFVFDWVILGLGIMIGMHIGHGHG